MPTVPIGNEPVKVVDINDPQGIVYNRSTTIQVFFGSTASLCNRADASILDPNATVAVDTDAEVWAVAPSLSGGNTVTVDYQPHGAAYFRGLTAGLGTLVLPAIKSPNFVHNASGWSVNVDGSAEFNNLTIRGTFFGTDFIINSSGIFIYSGVPATGNLVISIAAIGGTDAFGNSYGSGFTSFGSVGAAAQINAAAIGLFSGVNVVTEITPAGFFVYSPSGGAGNLVASVAPAGGTDAFGNAYLPGTVSYLQGSPSIATRMDVGGINWEQAASFAGPYSIMGTLNCTLAAGMILSATGGIFSNGLTVQSSDLVISGRSATFTDRATPSIPVGGVSAYSNNGHLKYVSDDGVDYATGRVTSHAANGGAGQTISAVTFTAITGMTVNVGVGLYKLRIVVDLTTAAAAGRWELALSTTGVTSTTDYEFFWKSGAGVIGGAVHQTSITTTQIGPNPSVIGPYSAVYEGIVRFTTAGTLIVTAATTIAADTFTVWDGSTIELEPIV